VSRHDQYHWTRHKPVIGDRVRITWRDADGTVTAIPWGTCVDVKLDDGRDCFLAGNDWAEGIDEGSIIKLKGGA
jgi:hypothetical protein